MGPRTRGLSAAAAAPPRGVDATRGRRRGRGMEGRAGPMRLFVPVRGAVEVVAIDARALPEDPSDVLELLQAEQARICTCRRPSRLRSSPAPNNYNAMCVAMNEQAPLGLWLDFAKAYLHAGRDEAALQILEEGSSDEIEKFFPDAKCVSRVGGRGLLSALRGFGPASDPPRPAFRPLFPFLLPRPNAGTSAPASWTRWPPTTCARQNEKRAKSASERSSSTARPATCRARSGWSWESSCPSSARACACWLGRAFRSGLCSCAHACFSCNGEDVRDRG